MPRKKGNGRKPKPKQPRSAMVKGTKTKRKKTSNIGTPYDDVFKTMAIYIMRLLLPLLNKLFGTRYTGKEKVEPRNNEHFTTKRGGKQQKRMTDSYFIVFAEFARAYVIECETNPDGSILIRIFEYTLQVTLENARLDGDALWVTVPNAAIIALRSTEKTATEMTVHITFPNSATVDYTVPVLRVKDYTLDEIFDEDLLFLLPFYIFTHEARFPEYEKDKTKLQALQDDLATIVRRVNECVKQGKLSDYEASIIIEMMGKVADSLTEKYTKVKKGVKKVVGGTVFVPKTEKMYRKGIAEGERKGKREGLAEGKREGLAEGKREGLAEGKREGLAEGKREGLAEGEARGTLNTLFALVEDQLIPLNVAASRANMTEDEFKGQMQTFKSQG